MSTLESSEKTIKVTCRGAETLPIDRLVEFQGKLKKISKKNLNKLKRSILKYGFSVPIFVWAEYDNYILDGHQRLRALCEMREEGYDIPMLPVDYIEAETESEAREKLLQITSQYGEFDLDGLNEFLEQIGKGFDFEDIRLADNEFEFTFEDTKNDNEGDVEEIEIKKDVCKKGDIWNVGDKIHLFCDSSEDKKHDYDVLFFDPMFDDENIYGSLPEYEEGKKLLLFSDFLRVSSAIVEANNKGWPFNYEFILDGCTSWYIPGRPLERHKVCFLYGNKKWNFENSIFDDGVQREDAIAKNERGEYEYKALEIGKHLSSLEKYSNAGKEKSYKYEKPICWIRAILNGCKGVSKIFDPFGGSFSSAVVAIENKWYYNGYEINPKVVDIGLMKIYQQTGKDPIRQDGKSFTELLLE